MVGVYISVLSNHSVVLEYNRDGGRETMVIYSATLQQNPFVISESDLEKKIGEIKGRNKRRTSRSCQQ